jgi:hypothetical protein
MSFIFQAKRFGDAQTIVQLQKSDMLQLEVYVATDV